MRKHPHVGRGTWTSIEERFLSKTEEVLYVEELGACLIWKHGNSGDPTHPYGRFFYNGKMRSAHVWSYNHWIGDIESGLELDHLCNQTLCVNYKHLEPVTKSVNQKRGWWGTRTHCPHGHEYTEENTYIFNGHRSCKKCTRKAGFAYYHNNRLENA